MMKRRTNRHFWLVISLLLVVSAMLLIGCPKRHEPASAPPPAETKKEAPEAVSTPPKTEKEPAPSPPAAQHPPSQKTEQPAPTAPPKPISSGSTLLNPSVSEDAKVIQARLAELGFYKMKIDGIWGKGSRAALKAFKEKNSLGNPDKWDKETQILLFQGTDK